MNDIFKYLEAYARVEYSKRSFLGKIWFHINPLHLYNLIMKIKFSKMFLLGIRFILLFVVVMFVFYLPEHMRTFCNDWHCNGSGEKLAQAANSTIVRYANCNYNINGNDGFHEPTWHWGFRHFLFVPIAISLFVCQIIEMVRFWDSRKYD